MRFGIGMIAVPLPGVGMVRMEEVVGLGRGAEAGPSRKREVGLELENEEEEEEPVAPSHSSHRPPHYCYCY